MAESEQSAVDIATAVRSGATTARTQVEAALARLEERNLEVNAFTTIRRDEAMAEADALDAGGVGHDGLLAGVPVAVKEEYDVTGTVTTLGGCGNSTPKIRDSEAIRRLRAAGAIIIGKTTMPEFGQFPFTESMATGITRNPSTRSDRRRLRWRLGRGRRRDRADRAGEPTADDPIPPPDD